jgi:hypothetical protein
MPDMYEIVDAGFGYAELDAQPTVIWRHPTPDGREATVTRARLRLGRHGDRGDDVYCYATSMSAVLSAALWIEGRCTREPGGWTRHLATGRDRAGGVPNDDERAWVCPHHPDQLPRFENGHLFCAGCGREVADAVRVPWPPPGRAARAFTVSSPEPGHGPG